MQKTSFMHYRKINGGTVDCRGGATLAIRDIGNGKIAVGSALCNSSDVFNKKLGRAIAEGRLNKYMESGKTNENVYILEVNPEQGTKEQVHAGVGQYLTKYSYT